MTDRVHTQTPSTNGNGAEPEDVDPDAVETTEWLEALDAVVSHDGPERARDLLTRVIERAQYAGTGPSAGCARSCAGTPSAWCCAPTRSPRSWAGTSPPTSPWPRSLRSASTISGTG